MNTSNGSDRRTQGAMGNMAHFLRDLVALFQLQGALLAVEAGDEFRKARSGLLALLALAVLAICCVPLGLAALALVIAENTRLSIGQSLLGVAAVGLTSAGAGIYWTVRRVEPATNRLARSRIEWQCNMDWIKETLKSLGDRNSPVETHFERPRR
jgi:uncharacterized membrane protein YqjE